ncbi:MAG: 50S ribosomal protein L35ae [bacterium]|nr:50S ribosomal protein L35ae [bacterium]
MEGVVLGYQRGKHTQYTNKVILKVFGVDNKNIAARLIGKKVIWKEGNGKKIIGKIVKTHGNKGCVLAVFRTNLPGQAVYSKVEIR